MGPHCTTYPRVSVSVLGLVFKCNQPCRTPACRDAQALCETPICLVHWDEPSPREPLEWKREYEKAQLKRQRWAAAWGHRLSAALLQTTLILMQRVRLPCLHTTQRSETDRCAKGSRIGCLTHAGIHAFMHAVSVSPSLLSCLANIFPLTPRCTFYPSRGDLLTGRICVKADRFIQWAPSPPPRWQESEQVISRYRAVGPI